MSQTKRRVKQLSRVKRPTNIGIGKKAAASGVLFAAVLFGFYSMWENRVPLLAAGEEFIAKTVGASAEHIMVKGVKYTDAEELSAAIGIHKGDSLVGFDSSKVRENIESLAWVAAATVNRQLPSTININIVEHTPVARLLEDTMFVINIKGEKIVEVEDDFKYLPTITGTGAADKAADLFATLKPYSKFLNELQQATYIGERRWDFTFKQGVTVQLPEVNLNDALNLLLSLDETRNVLALTGGVIDMRLEDRVVFRLPDSIKAKKSFRSGDGVTL